MKMIKKSINTLFYEIISSKNRVELFRQLPWKRQGRILHRLPHNYRIKLLEELRIEELADIICVVEPEIAADILRDAENRTKVLKLIDEKKKEKIQYLSRFKPDTAAGVMSLDFIAISPRTTFKKVGQLIRRHESNTGKFPTLLVVQKGLLLGELPGHAVAVASANESVAKYIKKMPQVLKDDGEKKVISYFKRYRHNKIAVAGRDKKLIGIIYSDSVMALIQKHTASQFYRFAGVRKEEDVLDPAYTKVKHRYRWLLINLATAFIAASVVGLFESTLTAFVFLAIYMPIVAGMGGNAGAQAFAVVIRGLALKEIGLGIAKKVIVQEVIAGLLNGLIVGVVVALVGWLYNGSYILGFVLALALVINLMAAGFFGAFIPILMKRLGFDPASSASIFITTGTDIVGFFVFLSLATIMLT